MATKFCICGKPAVMRATLTTIDGEVLDTTIYCRDCAEWHRDAFNRAGLIMGGLPAPRPARITSPKETT